MRARYYDPLVGRFYGVDPVGFTGGVDIFNRYAYVANNPFKYLDPTGMSKEDSKRTVRDLKKQEQKCSEGWRCYSSGHQSRYDQGGNAHKESIENRQSCSGQMCRGLNNTENNSPSAVEQFLIDHGYGSLSLRGGFIVVGALDVIVTAEVVSVYFGGGLGAGLSATATVGAYAGPDSSGFNIKTTAAGGFGVGANASFRVSEQGVTPSAGIGTGLGASFSTTLGYKVKIKDF